MKNTLDVVIVNWNAGPLLRECLRSILTANRMEFDLSRVVIVDNGSSDGSVADLQDINLPIALILNSDNKGLQPRVTGGQKTVKLITSFF